MENKSVNSGFSGCAARTMSPKGRQREKSRTLSFRRGRTLVSFSETKEINAGVKALRAGGVIAYPTEAVYGLGCDPFCEAAVRKILRLKERRVSKGLILLAATWEQVAPLVKKIPAHFLAKALDTWPGPHTWIFPAKKRVPTWIKGAHESIAIRVTAHPVAKKLCKKFGSPIVSTSANISGQPPAKSRKMVLDYFRDEIDFVFSGRVGKLKAPTPITNILTEKVIR